MDNMDNIDKSEINFEDIYKVIRISDETDNISENLLDTEKSSKNCCSYLSKFFCFFLYN